MRANILLFFALYGVVVNGQVRQPHSLYFMETIPQVAQMNPAVQPRANGYVLLPANVNIDLHSNNLAVKDILQQQGNKWYTPVEKKFDYNKLYKATGNKPTMFNLGVDVDIIGFGFRARRGYLSFGMSQHISGTLVLPGDLFKITENGFPEGTKLDFSPLRTQAIGYMQFLVGYSYKLTDRLTIGTNVKTLVGQAAVATKIQKFRLNTGEQQWDAEAKGNIYSSAPFEVIMNAEGKIHDIKEKSFKDYTGSDFVTDYITFFDNPGIAFDLGATYQIDERLTVSASLNNLGFISWKKDLNSMSFNGSYSFDGIKYDVSDDKDIEEYFEDLLDELDDAVGYRVQHKKFKTPLTPVFHAGASYSLSKSVSAGFLSRTVFWENGVRQSFNLSLYLQPYSFVAFNAGVTYQVKGNVYLGGGLMFHLQPLPLQFYILTDYAPVYYSTLRVNEYEKIPIPEHQKSLTLRVGLNLIFGRHGYTNKPMLDKGKSSWN